jgi:AcrR family transcriptional regulator
VIAAALAVGLEKLTMAAVAEKLGVGKAVLYGYVASREELVELAAAHALTQHHFPSDGGQAWSVWILEYARALFEVMTSEGQLFESWLSGVQSPMVEVDAAEMWLTALTRRGFSGDEALQLRQAVSQLVIGAAASMKHIRAWRLRGQPRPASMEKAVLSRPRDELPLLREFFDVFAREPKEDGWEFGLFLLLQGVTTARAALQPNAHEHPFAKQRLRAGKISI